MPPQKPFLRIKKLILKGQTLSKTVKQKDGFESMATVDAAMFAEWKAQSLSCLRTVFGDQHDFTIQFEKQVQTAFIRCVQDGLGILRGAKEDIDSGNHVTDKQPDAMAVIDQICSRFHLIVCELRQRHGDRSTLDVQDEYDLQDLMRVLLHLHFDDVRREEWTPSYAGKSCRMDFLLKRESIVIELKMARIGLGSKELSTQLIEDIARYETHPDCGALVCFVYDPLGRVSNKRGFEDDLSRDTGAFPIRVLVRP